MTQGVSVKSYYHISENAISFTPDKQQGAETFLYEVYSAVDKQISLPQGHSFYSILDQVRESYYEKQGILTRIWECFVSIIMFPLRYCCSLYLTEAQRIDYYVEEIKSHVVDYFQHEKEAIQGAIQNKSASEIMELIDQEKDPILHCQVATICMESGIEIDYMSWIQKIDRIQEDEKPIILRFVEVCAEKGKLEELYKEQKKIQGIRAIRDFLRTFVQVCIKKKQTQFLLQFKDNYDVDEDLKLQAAQFFLDNNDLDLMLEMIKEIKSNISGFTFILNAARFCKKKGSFEDAIKVMSAIQYTSIFHDNIEEGKAAEEELFKQRIEIIQEIASALNISGKYGHANSAISLVPLRDRIYLRGVIRKIFEAAIKAKDYKAAISAAEKPFFYMSSNEKPIDGLAEWRQESWDSFRRLQEECKDSELLDKTIRFIKTVGYTFGNDDD